MNTNIEEDSDVGKCQNTITIFSDVCDSVNAMLAATNENSVYTS